MATARITRETKSRGLLTRDRSKIIVVSAATLVCVYLCYRLAQPFIPALVFAITIAIVTQPLIRWFERRANSPATRAFLTEGIVVFIILVPLVTIVYFVAQQIVQSVQNWQVYLDSWQSYIQRDPRLATAWERISQNLDLTRAIERFARTVNTASVAIATGSFYIGFQVLVMLYVLFFLYRDRDRLLRTATSLSPLTTKETNRLLDRLGDTIHATVFGVVVLALVQGSLGGLIFWLLGIPGAILWASVMGVFAMIPNLGTPIIWAPTALFLAIDGQWVKAIILVAYGLTAIGLIDNLLYPTLVGNRLHSHTLTIFLSILGGLAVFGAAGMILGPVIVNTTAFLLELWRRRTEHGRQADAPAQS